MQRQARRTTSLLAGWLALALAAGLAACGSQAAPGSASTGVGATTSARVPAAARHVTCPVLGPIAARSNPPGQPGQPIPPDFSPVAVVQCIQVSAAAPGRGQWTNVRKEVAVAGLGALMTALRQPSARRTLTRRAVGCPFMAAIVPWLMLIGRGGQLIHPRIPVTVCGAPIAPVLASLNSLHWIELATTPEPRPVN